ncbi:MAG: hypothetical protein ACXWTY_10535 [Methylobacter sp.]
MKPQDHLTLDLFCMDKIPNSLPTKAGAFKIGLNLRKYLAETIKESPLTREQIVERMSELLGTRISLPMLNRWLAYSSEEWRFPLEYLPALEATLGTHVILEWMADLRGVRLLVGREILEYELGKAALMKSELKQHEARLKKALGGKYEHQ